VRTSGLFPVAFRREQQARADDVCVTRAELGRRLERLPDRELCLQKRVAFVQRLAVRKRSGPAHHDV